VAFRKDVFGKTFGTKAAVFFLRHFKNQFVHGVIVSAARAVLARGLTQGDGGDDHCQPDEKCGGGQGDCGAGDSADSGGAELAQSFSIEERDHDGPEILAGENRGGFEADYCEISLIGKAGFTSRKEAKKAQCGGAETKTKKGNLNRETLEIREKPERRRNVTRRRCKYSCLRALSNRHQPMVSHSQWQRRSNTQGGMRRPPEKFFEPKGLFGWVYWYALYPIHSLIFGGLIRKIGETAR
jgi:hypothetical protein